MKKYTIEEIKKWGNSLNWEDSGLVYHMINNVTEEEIDEANGYTPNTHVESENKFEGPLCRCSGEEGIDERDIPY